MGTSLLSIQDVIEHYASQAQAQEREREWKTLPPLQARASVTMKYHWAMCQTASLVPMRHPWFVRDAKTILVCQWASEELREDARNALSRYYQALKRPLSPGYVYVLKAGPYYKIGRTTQFSQRIKTIELQMPFPVEIYAAQPSFNVERAEGAYHHWLQSNRSNGEWFALHQPCSENQTGLDRLHWFGLMLTSPKTFQGMMDEPIADWLLLYSSYYAERLSWLLES